MTERLIAWYMGRAPRERVLLSVAAVLAALVIVYLLTVPVSDALSDARTRHADAVIALGETQARVDAVKALQVNRPPTLDQPLDALIRTSADTAGFALGNVAPQGDDRVQITIASARPGALLRWIADLEGSGILVDQLGTTDNGDKTVSAQMTLKARGL